ncbi:hypothetical protein IFM89_012088 [Coptis chinensis]|uniref:Pectinesterase catalytic domain-containing protein n=1 Tax=Coptis chinensis TaxID=261450 RepID=A0A835LVD9_9MAGN|nr:hypothetical protein IFM89_012088 [Coptis chinensis]
MGRVLVAGISIIFVVGVIVGIVVIVNRGNDNTSHQSNGGLSTGMKAVETLCDPMDYKETPHAFGIKKTHLTPNVVVARDGSGQFETITEAISTYSKNNEGRFIIYVKVGQYHEKVTIPETTINIFIYGYAWS